jgi:serine O-acetyltransferase
MSADQDLNRGGIVNAILESYSRRGELAHLEGGDAPSRQAIWEIVEDLLRIVFPGFLDSSLPHAEEIRHWTAERVSSVERRMAAEIRRALRLCKDSSIDVEEGSRRAWDAAQRLLEAIPAVRDQIARDIDAAMEGDPAATSVEEIILAYPGLQAIAVQRMAHILYRAKVPLVPRVMTEYAHSRTGIDIHPGATIGNRFFIDHGTGVVIGETSAIGNEVKIYQGVTLGARSFPKDGQGQIVKGIKRHPNIEDQVTIYSGATILGNITIGAGSVIGGNVWLTASVPPGTKIMVRPAQKMRFENHTDE